MKGFVKPEKNNYSVPISGPIFQEKALLIAEHLLIKDFKALNGVFAKNSI